MSSGYESSMSAATQQLAAANEILAKATYAIRKENAELRQHLAAQNKLVQEMAQELALDTKPKPKAEERPVRCLFCNKPYGYRGNITFGGITETAACGHQGPGSNCALSLSNPDHTLFDGPACNMANRIIVPPCYTCRQVLGLNV